MGSCNRSIYWLITKLAKLQIMSRHNEVTWLAPMAVNVKVKCSQGNCSHTLNEL